MSPIKPHANGSRARSRIADNGVVSNDLASPREPADCFLTEQNVRADVSPRACKTVKNKDFGGPVIVVDSREQTPWTFALPTVVAGLPVGDYSLLGHETEVAIERKSIDDFVGSVTFDRPRFWRELERLALYRLRAVVVESSLGAVLAGAYRSRAAPQAIVASALAIIDDLGIPVIWGDSRECSARIAEWMLRRWHVKHTAHTSEVA